MSEWTSDQVSLLKSFKKKGYSASSMTGLREFCGKSRNAILGKMHRLGMCCPKALKPKKPPLNRGGERVRVRSKIQASPTIVIATDPAQPESMMLGILELTGETCRWPSAGPPFTFCGHQRDERSKAYCEYHERRSRRRSEGATV